jgi:hypothetical protein
MADEIGRVIINILYIMRNLPWIKHKFLEDN